MKKAWGKKKKGTKTKKKETILLFAPIMRGRKMAQKNRTKTDSDPHSEGRYRFFFFDPSSNYE